MRLTLKEFEEVVARAREGRGDEVVLRQLEDFLNGLKPAIPKEKPNIAYFPVACPFNNDEWEVVRTYDFKRRTTFIYRNKITSVERAWDKLKRGEV